MVYRRRRYKRKRGKARGTVLRLTKRQARTKALDSKIERVIAKVADMRIQRAQIRLIKRNFIFSQYDPLTNFHIGGQKITWDGSVIPLSRIPLVDVETVPAQIGTDIPETELNESQAGQGVGGDIGLSHGGPDAAAHGYRTGDQIKVSAFSINLRAWIPKLEDGDVGNNYDNTLVYWSLVSVREESVTHVSSWEPQAKEVMPIRSWGYSSLLDLREASESNNMKYRTFAKGTVCLRPSTARCSQVNTKKYVAFKKPLLLGYQPGDQTGMYPTKAALFLVLRSNMPTAFVNEQATVSAVTKLYYVNTG